MLSISKKTRYGLRAMLYLAQQDELVSAKKIAQAEGIPHQFLEQIVNQLRQAQLVKAKRGAHGGYTLAQSTDEIKMAQIVSLLEEKIQLAGCLGGAHCHKENDCFAKKGWQKAQKKLLKTMEDISLADLLAE